MTDLTTKLLKESLHRGPYAWPGGYPIAYLCSDGGTLHPNCVRENFQEILEAIRGHDNSGWRVVMEFVNWEDGDLMCDHCGERIESAYAEPDEEPDDFPDFFAGYLECLLWSTARYSEEGECSDERWDDFDSDDFDAESLASHREQVLDFFASQEADLSEAEGRGRPYDHLGHDFCLSRNDHGTGFWDRGLGGLGDRLHEASKPYGSVDLYTNDGETVGIEG